MVVVAGEPAFGWVFKGKPKDPRILGGFQQISRQGAGFEGGRILFWRQIYSDAGFRKKSSLMNRVQLTLWTLAVFIGTAWV